jgi:hypothetical protein
MKTKTTKTVKQQIDEQFARGMKRQQQIKELVTQAKCMIDYFEKSLVPDLRAADQLATARDFQEAANLLRAFVEVRS